ncbi:MAG: hypothetical protein AB1715_13315 [Acidobacteriota bacterium]
MMARKPVPLQKMSVTEFLLQREERGLGRYRKRVKRDPEEQTMLLELALSKIEKAERNNFITLGFRRRRVTF